MMQPEEKRANPLAGPAAAELQPGPRGSLRTYLLASFGIAWVFQIAGSACALAGVPMGFTVLLMLCMFGPMLAVCITCRGLSFAKSGIRGWRPRFRGHWAHWLIAWLSPMVLTVLGCVCFFAAFPARFDPTASSYLRAAVGDAVYESLYASVPTAAYAAQMLGTCLLGAFINTVPALGEEAGWRGWMYPHLKARLGQTGGRIAGGLIWGVWHWPVMILTGYEYGWSVWNAPLYLVALGCVSFCLITVALGTLLDALYEKTGSIWAPALFHGAFNAVASAGLMFLQAEYAADTLLGPSAVGLLTALPMLVIACVLLVRGLRQESRL